MNAILLSKVLNTLHFYLYIPFTKGLQYFKYGGYPYCNDCYKKRALICAECNKEINVRAQSAMNKTFHPECLVCSFCNEAFEEGTFVAHNDMPYHADCYHAKFAINCFVCKKEIWGDYLYVEGAVRLNESVML